MTSVNHIIQNQEEMKRVELERMAKAAVPITQLAIATQVDQYYPS
jgi:hypothetical protein